MKGSSPQAWVMPGTSARSVGIDMIFSQALRTPLLWIVNLCTMNRAENTATPDMGAAI
ncbi:hypothetical protein QEM13_001863 [Pseudomonas putida]|nr:hypothetical protein [Pseudomonas putida]